MVQLPPYVAVITATFTIPLMAAAAEEDALLKQAQEIFQPLPKDMATAEFPITRERVELGRSLFFDPRLTIDASMSCSSCHQPAFYGTDALPNQPVLSSVPIRVTPRLTSMLGGVLSSIGAATGRTSRIRCSRRSPRRSHPVSPTRKASSIACQAFRVMPYCSRRHSRTNRSR